MNWIKKFEEVEWYNSGKRERLKELLWQICE